MSTVTIELPDELQAFVETQAAEQGLARTDYLRDLVEREWARLSLRKMLIEGRDSGFGRIADDAYFDSLLEDLRTPER